MSMIIRQDAASQRYFRRGSPHNKDKPPNEESILNDIKNEREKIMKKMKKSFRKVLAQMLVLAMCLTMLPMGKMTVKADDFPVALINSNATGSITVTKYVTATKETDPNRYVDDLTTTPIHISSSATGTISDAFTVPGANGYEALNGAKFKLTKIATKQDVMDFYNGISDNVYSVEDAEAVTGSEVYSEEGITAVDGTFKFEGLSVGIYLLEETTAPDQITAPYAEKCLISIPMVNTKTSENNSNAEWMYDVFVYPKNHESVGNVKLLKRDQNNDPVKDVEFSLKRILLGADGKIAADAAWEEVEGFVTNDGTSNTDATNYVLKTGADGKLNIQNLPANFNGTLYELTEVSAPAGYIADKRPMYFKVLTNNTIVWDGATDGTVVYKNENTSVTAVIDPDDATTLQLDLVNENPSIEKELKLNQEEEAWGSHDQFRMDATLTYKITAYVPHNVAEINYVIKDAPEAGIKVTEIKSVQIASSGATTDLATTMYTIDQSAPVRGFTFTFKKDADNLKETVGGNKVIITYEAQMTGADTVIEGTGNKNTASVEFSKEVDGDDTVVYTITDENVVYTFDFDLTKYLDEKNASKTAPGVQFVLYNDAAGTDENHFVQVSDGVYRLGAKGETANATLTTGTNGKLCIQGLENGTYYLKETKTLTGYNLLSGLVTITVNTTETTGFTDDTTWYDSENQALDTRVMKKVKTDGVAYTNKDASTYIINKKGFVLPQTGSMGYLLFCVAGILLVFGGAVLMFSGRKKTIR